MFTKTGPMQSCVAVTVGFIDGVPRAQQQAYEAVMTGLGRDVEVRLKGLVVVEVVVLSNAAIDKEVGGDYTSVDL